MIRNKLKKVFRAVKNALTEEPSIDPGVPEGLPSLPTEVSTPVPAEKPKLPSIPDETRKEAWYFFRDGVRTWLQGFEVEGAEQPNRLGIIQSWGEGRYTVAILIMAHEVMGLQKLVRRALIELDHDRKDDLDFVERVSATMIQICHMGYPDLAGTYDYSTKWRRE